MSDKKLARHLEEIRVSLGLSLTEAAKRLGFANYQTLRSIEAGEREVKVSELGKFAKVYYCSISSLLGQSEEGFYCNFLWRNLPKDENSRKETEGELVNICKQYTLFEKLLNLKPKKRLPEVTLDDIRNNYSISNLADDVRNCLGLGSRPAFTLQQVLEQDFNIKVLFHYFDEGSAVSMSHTDFGGVIVISSNEAPWRRKYDLAHELFHLLSWNIVSFQELKTDRPFFEDIEKKADAFASMLLLPESEIAKELNSRIESQKQITCSDLVDISLEFDVSTKALICRMSFLRYIKWEIAKKLAEDEELKAINREKKRSEWGETPMMSERYYELAIRCLRKGLISRGKFAAVTGIDRCDIDDFIEAKGLMELEGDPIEIMAS
jgi:Zn-dependent peptidase ImmA (M78 family)